jgi:hypothetical protein
MNDDPILLASRYLDGDLPTDERALVEGDPELLAEVARMRAVRDALADVPAPSAANREASVAAALAAADRPIAPPVASLTDRRRARWLVPAAAAIVGVAALGGLAAFLGGTGGDDVDDSASIELASETFAAADTQADGDDAGGGEDGAERTMSGDIESQAPAASAGDSQAATTAAAAEGTTGAPTADQEVLPRLSTPDELLDFATEQRLEGAGPATTARAATDLSALADTCDLGELVGAAYYTVDGTDEYVIVVVDPDEALAVTPTCGVVARAPLP